MSADTDYRNALIQTREWIAHWLEDIDAGLMPTFGSLSLAEWQISQVLAKHASEPVSTPVAVGSFGGVNSVIGGAKIVRAA